ncbi:MAG: hypothetical protein KatS3mg059_1765 [Thermomicrobiales bacterium]|nr:MAG: hypothetical protein KatS3mg059_1765 [Thermomicrobiales bacterium]
MALRRLAAAYVRAADDDVSTICGPSAGTAPQACGRDPDRDRHDRTSSPTAGPARWCSTILENKTGVLDALARHYDWIVYEDDYPEGCVTWLYTGRSPIDLLTEVTYGSQVFSGRV